LSKLDLSLADVSRIRITKNLETVPLRKTTNDFSYDLTNAGETAQGFKTNIHVTYIVKKEGRA
jgi:hypothetical protein